MDRVAVFVDAGYLFAQGAVALVGRKLARSSVVLDHGKALAALESFASDLSGLPLLRVYWYDGTATGPTRQHLTLAHLPGLKLRLGFINSFGEQKGVDSLIVTDMIALARNRAMADAVLLSGDEDLRVGVQQAQELGVRVHLLGIKPSRGSQSLFLLQEADSTHEWGPEFLSTFLTCLEDASPRAATSCPTAPAATSLSASEDDGLTQVAARVAAGVGLEDLPAVLDALKHTGGIPKDIDVQLLKSGSMVLGSKLESRHKRLLRTSFRAACEARLAAGSEAGP